MFLPQIFRRNTRYFRLDFKDFIDLKQIIERSSKANSSFIELAKNLQKRKTLIGNPLENIKSDLDNSKNHKIVIAIYAGKYYLIPLKFKTISF